jgi:ATP-dependent Clp protease ATP-binding subunit ClpA
MIKPILTAGDLRVIGSTTFEEYKQVEKDRALARRLQKIVIEEPSMEETLRILNGLRGRYEEHHEVTYTDAAIEAAAKLAGRHLRDYRLPDSAIDVMDEAGAVARLARNTVVDAAEIEAVVARAARIPARQASSSDRERLRTLEESLQRVVFGQQEAVHLVAQSIKRSRAGLALPERPAGCFLFTGPTGVGKTELAKQLALQLGNEFIRFDMSEYMEKHAVARLIGAPPGYVGFEQGGQLVDAVRTHPYAVVLLDEIEKAHADIYNILLQVMDHATLTDNTGRKADFRNVVLILTSNAGSRELSAASIGFGGAGERDETARRSSEGKSRAAIERVFSPEFRNRLDAIVTFGNLSPEVMETIVDKFILQLESQLAERRVAIALTPEARAWLARKGYDPVYGARPLARVIQREVRDPLTDELLFGKLEHGGDVKIGLTEDTLAFDYVPRAPDGDAPHPTPLTDPATREGSAREGGAR